MKLTIINITGMFGTALISALSESDIIIDEIYLTNSINKDSSYEFRDQVLKVSPIEDVFEFSENSDVVIMLGKFDKYKELIDECEQNKIIFLDCTNQVHDKYLFADSLKGKLKTNDGYVFNVPLDMTPAIYQVVKAINPSNIKALRLNLMLSANFFGKQVMDTLYNETVNVLKGDPEPETGYFESRYAFTALPLELIEQSKVSNKFNGFIENIKSVFKNKFPVFVSAYLLPQFSLDFFDLELTTELSLEHAKKHVLNINFVENLKNFDSEYLMDTGKIGIINFIKPFPEENIIGIKMVVDHVLFNLNYHIIQILRSINGLNR